MASCAESGCPQVRQRSGWRAKLSAPTVGEPLCMSKSVEAHYKGQIVSARDLPTGCQQQCSLVVPTVRATTSDRTERQVTSKAADEATGTRRSMRSASTKISLPARCSDRRPAPDDPTPPLPQLQAQATAGLPTASGSSIAGESHGRGQCDPPNSATGTRTIPGSTRRGDRVWPRRRVRQKEKPMRSSSVRASSSRS